MINLLQKGLVVLLLWQQILTIVHFKKYFMQFSGIKHDLSLNVSSYVQELVRKYLMTLTTGTIIILNMKTETVSSCTPPATTWRIRTAMINFPTSVKSTEIMNKIYDNTPVFFHNYIMLPDLTDLAFLCYSIFFTYLNMWVISIRFIYKRIE